MPTPSAPPAEAVSRFRRDLEQLIGTAESVPIGLAVSGGPDSLALLRLAAAALPGRISAATVDHGLRREAAQEAATVARHCESLGVPHAVLGPEPLASGNVQQAARRLRYRLLARWAKANALPFVATAHHRDDVAETFVMRLLRGSGVTGLARMAARAPVPGAETSVELVRPLLDWSRAELGALAPDGVDDPSNRDPRYDRARIRALIAASPALAPEAIARAANHLADAEDALEWLANQAWRSRATICADGITIDMDDLPRETHRRLAAQAIRTLAPLWTSEGLDRLVMTLEQGKTGTLAGVRGHADGGKWHFRLAPAHRKHC